MFSFDPTNSITDENGRWIADTSTGPPRQTPSRDHPGRRLCRGGFLSAVPSVQRLAATQADDMTRAFTLLTRSRRRFQCRRTTPRDGVPWVHGMAFRGPTPWRASTVLVSLISIALVAACTSTAAAPKDASSPTAKVTTAARSSHTSATRSSAEPATTPAQGSSGGSGVFTAAQARAALAGLVTLPKRPYVAGYQRSCSPGQGCVFGPAWTDDNNDPAGHNGCGTRDDVLAAQLSDVVFRNPSKPCVVISGVLNNPYTGTTIIFAKADADAIEIDHVVPEALAWDLGAARWTQQQRIDFANDTRLVLLAVDRASNQSKSDSGPGEWMPPNRGYWCAYDQRIVTILSTYRLAVTAPDKAAMTKVLARC